MNAGARFPRVRRALRVVWKGFVGFCVAYTACSLPALWAFRCTRMISGSMAPTLQGGRSGGDVALIYRLAYRRRAPRRGELVAFYDDEGVLIIKRVAGLPGETVRIADGRVWINGEPLCSPPVFRRIRYCNAGAFRNPANRFRLAPGRYFVLGDFSADSYDSRYWGGLRRDQICGRAVAIVWPPRRIGRL